MGHKKTSDGSPIYATPEWFLGQAAFLRTDDGTQQMDIDGSPGDTIANLWNGTGAGDTGADWTVSGQGSETAASAYSGTNGWDVAAATKDSTTVFNNGSAVDVAGTYNSISFWLNTQVYPVKSELQIEWLNGSDSKIGTTLKIGDYVTNFDLGVWQHVVIPISDFGLTANVQKLLIRYAKQAGQSFYFDDIKLHSGSSGPYTFQVAAPDDTIKYHVSMLSVILVGDSSGWAANKFAHLDALSNGLLLRHRRLSTDEVLWSINCKDNIDLFGRYHPQDDVSFSDGNMLVGFMIKPGKANIIVTDDDVVEYVVRDDLSSLNNARAFAHYGIEEV